MRIALRMLLALAVMTPALQRAGAAEDKPAAKAEEKPAAPEAKDLGPVADHAGDQSISVTIALKLEDLAGAEAMMQRVSTPGSPLYQQFLTPERFAAQFGQAKPRSPRSLRSSVTAA